MVKVGLEPAEMMMWTVTTSLISLKFHDIDNMQLCLDFTSFGIGW